MSWDEIQGLFESITVSHDYFVCGLGLHEIYQRNFLLLPFIGLLSLTVLASSGFHTVDNEKTPEASRSSL